MGSHRYGQAVGNHGIGRRSIVQVRRSLLMLFVVLFVMLGLLLLLLGLLLGLWVRHDVAQVRVLDIHIWVSRRHQGRPSEALA